jgi:hypothetical protein
MYIHNRQPEGNTRILQVDARRDVELSNDNVAAANPAFIPKDENASRRLRWAHCRLVCKLTHPIAAKVRGIILANLVQLSFL